MSFLAWIILGLVSGFIASKIINKTGEGLIMDIVLGVVGAFVGGWLSTRFLHGPAVSGLNITSFIVAIIGSIIVLLLYHQAVRARRELLRPGRTGLARRYQAPGTRPRSPPAAHLFSLSLSCWTTSKALRPPLQEDLHCTHPWLAMLSSSTVGGGAKDASSTIYESTPE